ncbi:hypothetical protein [Kribbella swartbergensis]
MTETTWKVCGHHHPPRLLHLDGCEHLESPREGYSPDLREPVGEETHLRHCMHCEQRAEKARSGSTGSR